MEKDPQAELISIMSELWKESEKDSYCDEDGVRYSSDGKILLSCPVDFSGQYVIKSGVTEICSQAFRKCSKLTSVIIRDSVKEIGCCSFELCTGLDSIEIPSSVTTIDMGAFTGSRLKSIIIPGSVKSIESSVFENCRELSYMVIREGVSTIGDYAFNGCVKLKKIKLPSSITKIGVDAFANCPNLVYVIVPDGTKSKFVQMGLKNVQGKIVDRKDSIFTPDYFPEFDLVPISSSRSLPILPLEPYWSNPFSDFLEKCFIDIGDGCFAELFGIIVNLYIIISLLLLLFVLPIIGVVETSSIFFCLIPLSPILVLTFRYIVRKRQYKRKCQKWSQEVKELQTSFDNLKKLADYIDEDIFCERYHCIAKNCRVGLCGRYNYEVVLEPVYSQISIWNENDDYILLEKDGKYGLLIEDKIDVPVEYDKIDWMSPYILIYKNGKVGACKSDGIKLLPVEYDSISYDENRRIIEVNKGSEFFHFDEFGKPLV